MNRFGTFLLAAWLSLAAQSTSALAENEEANLKALIFEASHAEVTVTEDGVARIGWVRDDVPVTVDGMRLDPPAGLGSWAAFKSVDGARYGDGRHGCVRG